MKYAILFHETEEDFKNRATEDESTREAYWGAWMAYSQAMKEAGYEVDGAALQEPEITTVVKLKDGQRLVQDGPFADTKEQLGGFMIADFHDLDTALEWAAKAPCASTGGTEVRPVMPCGEDAC